METGPGTRRGWTDRRFYSVAAAGAIVIVFAGFARTYYLKGAFTTPPLPPLVHLHGLVMTAWCLLFLAQARLIAARRVALHRRLGTLGALLAVLVLVVGIATAIGGARRGATPGPPPLVFLAIPLGDMLVFAVLAGAGLLLRSRPDFHRRLMLISIVGILTPAIARIPLEFIRTGGPLVYFGLTDLCVLACVVSDTLRHRRLHPAFGWGAALIIVSQPARLALAGTSAWMTFARWLAG